MTREEAIKGLKVLRNDFSGYKPNEEMFDMAISDMECAVPKKPIATLDYTWGIHKKEAVCPKCDAFLNHIEFIGDQVKPTYCEFCGQAINWEGWKWDK